METESSDNLEDGVLVNLSKAELLAMIAAMSQTNSAMSKTISDLEKQIQELKNKNPTDRLDEEYSLRSEEKRKKKKRKKKSQALRSGRVKTIDKIAMAHRTDQVFPDGVDQKLCQLSHTRVAWRIEEGKAVLIAYEIYRYGKKFGKPAGLIGRGEFGIEILISLAYQVYCIGISIDKACEVLQFFQELKLTKSQSDSLLNQLARYWEPEFETLCTLLANSAVVHCDETSWSINSVWAFLTEQLTVVFHGVHKDGATLQKIIDKTVFKGVMVSDNAAIYQGFNCSQKCWAHLIRKAIKLTLQAPDNQEYRDFTDELLALYCQAKRSAADGRLNDAGRAKRVVDLNCKLVALCATRYANKSTEGSDVENDYRRLVNEIMRLKIAGELFVFVTTAGVEGTNNVSERALRDSAKDRRTGRTNKTAKGAKRQTVLTSVLRTLLKQTPGIVLGELIKQVNQWQLEGRSCFAVQAAKLGFTQARAPTQEGSLVDRVVLQADVKVLPPL